MTGAGTDQVDLRRFERRAMGSPLRMTVVDMAGSRPVSTEVEDPADAAWSAVSETFEAAEQAMSRFRDTSDLTAVNRLAGTGRAMRVDRRLAHALIAADRAGRLTAGRFDARVLGDLERLGSGGIPIGPVGMVETRSEGRWLSIDVRSSTVALEAPIDLGGIGKGLALRWAADSIDRMGLAGPSVGILLEAGGDLIGRPPAPEGGDWSIAIEDPEGLDEPKAVVQLRSGAVATSSISIHQWRDPYGQPVHHLIDPQTGEPGGAGLLAVTVAGPDPAWAEVWSKSLFLAGADGIATLARSHGLASWWVRDDGRLEMTPAARVRTLWSSADA